MATGFMPAIIALCLLAAAAPAAADVAVINILSDKALVVSVDGGEPKTIRVGQAWKGITVVAIDRDKDQATLEIDGKQRTLRRGQQSRAQGPGLSGRQSAVLSADSRGHFITDGSINGGHMRFMVDTGATAVAIPAADAVRLGLDFKGKGRVVRMSTANGVVDASAMPFERVKVGYIDV